MFDSLRFLFHELYRRLNYTIIFFIKNKYFTLPLRLEEIYKSLMFKITKFYTFFFYENHLNLLCEIFEKKSILK